MTTRRLVIGGILVAVLAVVGFAVQQTWLLTAPSAGPVTSAGSQ